MPAENTEPGLLQALGQAYVEMVRLFRAGDMAGAGAIRSNIQSQLGGLIDGAYRAGLAHLAAGRTTDAFMDLTQSIELHRTNIANLEMPVTVADCFAGLRAVYAAQGQALGAAAATRLGARGGQSFYAQPRACQVPVLGGLYELMFGERADGVFVEVGAFDGESYSNTANLADLGWRGLYIEPEPGASARCRQRHAGNPKIDVLQCAIGAEDGVATLWQNGPCSTTSPDEHAMNMRKGVILADTVGSIDVPLRRLDAVLTETGIQPGFDLLVVDVDGSEEAVFAGFDVARWQPRFMIVELLEDSPTLAGDAGLIAAARRVRALIAHQGYAEIYRDFTNTIFRAADARGLTP